ncbi:MAG TPA: trypsin-like peptidase domain-containing protein [Thermoanaerobaculia bacterium]|nr:trypsin-like peptidase domain-containing protein [Thermoanaerobaculia bacterium]
MRRRQRRISAVLLTLASLAGPVLASPLPSRRSEVVEVVEKVAPAVVNIAAEQTVRRARSVFDQFFFGLDPRPAKSLGSGVIIDPKGIILTNDHVISGASRIVATTKTGQELACDVIGSDADNDLAVLRVKKPGAALPTIKMGSSSDLLIGETVVAIGNPFGLSNTVTAGVLSALGRSVPGENQRVYNDFIQIDAPINPGNSGGPVVNVQGDLIGVATAIIGGAQGIGFAIPVDRARRIISDLVKFGHVKPVWVGLHGRTVASREQEGRGKGFRIRSVDPGSPAERAGIRPGDQIVAVDSTPIDSEESFETALSTRGPGRPMKIVLKGGSGERTVNLSGQDPPADYGVRILRGLGMSVRPARGGLRISIVDARGAAAHAGLESGDTLLALNGTAVADTDDINKVLSRDQSRTTLVMVVGRGSWEYTLTFPLD